MKTNKLSKKVIITLSLIALIIGVSEGSVSLNNSLPKGLNEENKFFSKILRNGDTCAQMVGDISLSHSLDRFDKKQIEKGINACKGASLRVKNTPIPIATHYKYKEFLRAFRDDSSSGLNHVSTAFEYLLKTDGRIDDYVNKQEYYDNQDIALVYYDAANSYRIILMKQYIEDNLLKLNTEPNNSSLVKLNALPSDDLNASLPSDLNNEDAFASKIMDKGKSCFYSAKEIHKSIKENTFNKSQINKGINVCNDASLNIKSTSIQREIYDKHQEFLKMFRDDIGNSCKYLAISFEYLLKTNGQFGKNTNYKKFLDNNDYAIIYSQSANSYRLILKKQYVEEKYRLK